VALRKIPLRYFISMVGCRGLEPDVLLVSQLHWAAVLRQAGRLPKVRVDRPDEAVVAKVTEDDIIAITA
jgi:hypothetical protein